MAGVVPKRTSGRKQWSLHDGPRSSLKSLREQMATDGCAESQVVIAKLLLDEQCELEADTKENERSGVYWLIKASSQGNKEATNLLKTCLQSGKGINELNYLDVKSCITMSQNEKVARRAAREMFSRLSNGSEYITTDLLRKKILAIEREVKRLQENGCNGEIVYDKIDSDDDDDTNWSVKCESPKTNEKLTEDHLVSAAIDYSHGLLPIVSRTLCLSAPNFDTINEVPLTQRSILHPFLELKLFNYNLVKFLGRQFSLLVSLNRTETLFFACTLIYLLIIFNDLLIVIPTVLYFVSFGVMVVHTFQMLLKKREYHDFRLWSGLFICYSNGELNAEEAEYQYICNNLRPYAFFFGALFVNFLVYPVIIHQWVPHSEIMLISFCITLATLLKFMQSRRSNFDSLLLLSFGLNVLAKYPYEIDPVVTQSWTFLDLKIPAFASYVIGYGIEFCVHFHLLLYLCIPVLLIKVAARQNWKGTYKALLPHCVTLSWLQMFILSSQGATMFGLLRGSLAVVGFVLFLPLFGLTSVVLPAAALTKSIISSNLTLNIFVFIALASLSLGLYWTCAQTRYNKILALIQISTSFVAAYVLIHSSDYKDKNLYYENAKLSEYLPWEVYQRFCNQPVWQEENIALAQIKCAELQDSHVNWDGYVHDVRIQYIANKLQKMFNRFPDSFRNHLYCLFGEETQEECSHFPLAVREECETFYNVIKSVSPCSLQKYNSYTFEVTLRMNSGIWGKSPEVIIVVDNFFKNFTLDLKPGDHVWFKGTLFNNEVAGVHGVLGGIKTYANLLEIGCLTCTNSNLDSVRLESGSKIEYCNIFNALRLGLKFILNTLLSPINYFR